MVYGLQARAYLERGTADNNPDAYKKAAEYARKAITTSGCTPLTQAAVGGPDSTGFTQRHGANKLPGSGASPCSPATSVANLF